MMIVLFAARCGACFCAKQSQSSGQTAAKAAARQQQSSSKAVKQLQRQLCSLFCHRCCYCCVDGYIATKDAHPENYKHARLAL